APCHMNPPPVIGAAIVSGWATASARIAITTNTPLSAPTSGDPMPYRTPTGLTLSLLPSAPPTGPRGPRCGRTCSARAPPVGANAPAGSLRGSGHAPVSSAPASAAMTAIIFFLRSSSLGVSGRGTGVGRTAPRRWFTSVTIRPRWGDRVRGPGPATPTGRARVVSRGGLGEDPRGGVDQAGDVVAAEAVEQPRDIAVVLDLQLDVEAGRG